QPRVRPVRGREREERRGAVVQVGTQPAEPAALAEERAEALLVAAALAHDLVAALALEVAPLADENGRDVELLGHHAEVPAQREPDLLDRPGALGNRVERGVESGRALPHRLVEEVLLRLDVVVERALLHTE